MRMKKMSLLFFTIIVLTELASAQSNGICYVDGTTHTTLAQAINCAGASGTIEITPSAGTVSVPSNATIPAGVTLRVDRGAILSIANAVTLTINGPLQAPGAGIFAYTGTGSVALGGLAAAHVIPNWFPGSDMGAQLMNAAAALPTNGGTLYPAPGSYRVATAVDFVSSTKAVTVSCERGVHGSGGGTTPLGATTEFTYSGTGAFFRFDAQTHSGMYGCTLIGPDGITGTTAIGALVGGGANNGLFDNFSHNDISGFGNGGLVFGNNVYIAIFQENVIHDNGPNGGKNIVIPKGLLNFGENLTFFGGILSNKTAPFSATCVDIERGTDIHFVDVSFDHCGLTANSLNVDVYLTDNHVENTGGPTPLPFFTLGPECTFCYLDWRGGYIREDTPSARTDFFEDNSTFTDVNNQISITSGIMVPSENVVQLVLVNHPCCDQVSVGPIQNGQGGFTFTSMVGGNPIGSIAISPINGIEVYKTAGIIGRPGASELGVDPATQRWVMNNGNNGTEFIPGSFRQLITPFAPTIAANGCGGGGATIAANNGPASFTINVGTSPATACSFTLPIAAATGWNCTASDLTTSSTNVFLQKQTATTTTTATITNFNDVAVASKFSAGDILAVSCFAR
jgi:hypothetical protein